ncbi:MAG: spore maturation protein [Clostridia bacterium]|nr:spore maturation protein [Clostridia bacterium]
MLELSHYVVPLILFGVAALILFCRQDLFSEFVVGARDGLKTAVGLLPSLVALICGISMFTASGAADALASLLAPVLSVFGVPKETVPLIAVRPFSGGGATAMLSQVFEDSGCDGFAGRCASVIAGSSDTVFYILGVYFSSVKVKKTRGAVVCALATMLFCVIFSCFLVKNTF